MIVEIGGKNFDLLPERAAFWTEEKVLLCSDLHWGREAYLQKMGMAIPERSFKIESQVLTDLLERTMSKELWILGDFIHHPEGVGSSLIGEIENWLTEIKDRFGVRTTFVPGNHDRKLHSWASGLSLEIAQNGIRRGNFYFLHEPPRAKESEYYYWYGHLHPAVRIEALFGNRKMPCFLVRQKEAYLPAFSRLAGGASVTPESQTDRIYFIAENSVYALPQARFSDFPIS